MSGRPQTVRVVTGSSVAGALVSLMCRLILLAVQLALMAVRAALVVGAWLFVNVVIPGVRLAARLAVRLATTLAARAAACRAQHRRADR